MSILTLRPGASGNHKPALGPEWKSLTTIRRRWVVAAFAACALYAGAVALFTSNDLHRRWGIAAACGYLLAAAAALAWKSRGIDLALALGLAGTLILPLGWLAAQGKQQPEVSVITRSAQLMIHHGTPYQSTAALAAAHMPYAYDPYLPVMTLFGLPRALGGAHVLTDPRIWFGVVFVVAFGLALVVAGAKDWIRWTVFVTASPVIAFELAVGGTDIPVLALMCLGLALLWETSRHGPRPVLAGLVLGIDAAMKATAWPALVIGIALLAVRDGKRVTAAFTVTALAACAVLVGPVAALWPGALVVNTISFPLGLTKSISPAASPLPGHLLAQTGHVGHLIAVGLLALAGLSIAVSLLVAPPRDVPAATWRLILGLALMFTLAPATRFGYYIYPAGLLVWMFIARAGRRQVSPEPPVPSAAQANT
jgi:Glycosyltransferase family 87